MPFREAYRLVAAEIRAGRFTDDQTAMWRAAPALVEPAVLNELRAELAELQQRAQHRSTRVAVAEAALLQDVPDVFGNRE